MSALVVADGASEVRRAVGPLAWVVLEQLAATAAPDGSGELVAETNVRQLAVEIGVGKDAVARALRRLVAAGFVQMIERRSAAGRFDAVAYVVTKEAPVRPRMRDERPRQSSRAPHHPRHADQLSPRICTCGAGSRSTGAPRW